MHGCCMATKRFEKRVNFLLTASEGAMLQDLAERDEVSHSDVVRRLIRRAHAEAFGERLASEQRPAKLAKARKRK